jgi:hypothetical protein
MPKKLKLKERLLREYAKISKVAPREPRSGREMFIRLKWERLRKILWRRYDYMQSL